MLAQFQTRYPTGSLLSELLTIYQGKFVVRASVQIEGVARATGMAIAETLELAEDRARERALAVVLSAPASEEVPEQSIPSPQITELTSTPDRSFATDDDFFREPAPRLAVEPETATFTDYPEFAPTNLGDRLALTEPEKIEPAVDADFDSSFVNSFSNVKPFIPRIAKEEVAEQIELPDEPIKPGVSEPIDLSDTLIAIETALKNLPWTAEQERRYLKRTYAQESRDALTTQQLFEFLSYLEVFAQTSQELKRLGWDNNQGKQYLLQKYNKQSRQYLNYQELQEFLQYLQAEPALR